MKKEARKNWTRFIFPLLILVAALTLSARVWRPLLLYGHSSCIDGWRMLVFDEAIRAGNWLPRWTPDYYYGYGSPIFHFYAPLPYYLSEIWHLLGFSIVASMKLTLVATWALSGLFMYLLARDYLSRPASFAAGLFYMMAPYHLVDMLVRHAFGEHVAFAWMPLIAWGAAGCVKKPDPLRFAAGAAGLALLALSHNITALIFMPFAIGWVLFEFARFRSWRGLAAGAACLAGGLFLSAFFWLPAFVEKKLVWASESLTEEFFRYEDHFIHFKQLFAPYWGFGGSRAGVKEDFMSQQIGLAHWLWIALALAAFVYRFKSNREAASPVGRRFGSVYGLMVFVFAALMTLPVSKFIWDALPLLAFVQFPWRFLGIAALGASLWAASAVDWIEIRGDSRRALKPAATAVVCILAAYLSYTKPQFAVCNVENGDIHMGDYKQQMDMLKNYPSMVKFSSLLSRRHIISEGKTGVSRDDYLPRSVEVKPTRPAAYPVSVQGGTLQKITSIGANAYAVKVVMNKEGFVRLNQFYFPGWTAQIDGRAVETRPEAKRGRVEIVAPPGERLATFRFKSTPLRCAADAISLVTLILLISVTGFLMMRKRKET